MGSVTKNHTMLQKKLQELESLLHDAVSASPEDVAPRKYNISRDIELRIIFLKTLMAAEISSNQEVPENLSLIAGRLTELEDAFHRWNSCEDPLSEPEAEDAENFSACSCTESCIDKREEEEDEEEKKDEEEELVGLVDCGVKEEEIRDCKVGKGKKFWLIRVLAVGFLIFFGFGLFGGFQHVEHECYLMPT